MRLVLALALLVAGPAAAGDRHESTTLKPAAECEKRCGGVEKPCERIEFLGFSPDSTRIGFMHLTCPGPHSKNEPRLTYHVRELSNKKRKLRLKRLDLGDVRFPEFYARNEYFVLELPDRGSDGLHRYDAYRGVFVDFHWKTEKRVAWYLTVSRKDKELFTHRGEFEEIYFGVQPSVYLSPDGEKVAVVMVLDAMIKVDSGIAAFSLNP